GHAAVDHVAGLVGAEVTVDLLDPVRGDVRKIADREVDPAAQRGRESIPPRAVVGGEPVAPPVDARHDDRGGVDVAAVHLGPGQTGAEGGGEGAAAAAQVDDDAGVGAVRAGDLGVHLGTAPG